MRKFAIFSIISLCFIVVMMVIIVSGAQNNISSRNNDAGSSTTTTAVTSSGGGPVTFDDKLARVDAALNELIDACSKDIYSSVKETCVNEIEDAWWMECSEYYDKLDTCKSGKVENFLKNEGRL